MRRFFKVSLRDYRGIAAWRARGRDHRHREISRRRCSLADIRVHRFPRACNAIACHAAGRVGPSAGRQRCRGFGLRTTLGIRAGRSRGGPSVGRMRRRDLSWRHALCARRHRRGGGRRRLALGGYYGTDQQRRRQASPGQPRACFRPRRDGALGNLGRLPSRRGQLAGNGCRRHQLAWRRFLNGRRRVRWLLNKTVLNLRSGLRHLRLEHDRSPPTIRARKAGPDLIRATDGRPRHCIGNVANPKPVAAGLSRPKGFCEHVRWSRPCGPRTRLPSEPCVPITSPFRGRRDRFLPPFPSAGSAAA